LSSKLFSPTAGATMLVLIDVAFGTTKSFNSLGRSFAIGGSSFGRITWSMLFASLGYCLKYARVIGREGSAASAIPKKRRKREVKEVNKKKKINKSGLVLPICKLYQYSIVTSPVTAPEKLDGVYVA
jgi:hypothetical protein